MFNSFDPTRSHPLLGTAVGLILLTVLVPILEAWHGSQGVLGQSIPLLFLVPVIVTAALAGRGAGVGVAVVAVGAWDWFFIPPHYRITIASVGDATSLVVFLAIALLTGQLATIARSRTREALHRAQSSQALYELSSSLIGRHHLSDVLASLVEQVRATFNLKACAVLLAPDGDTVSETAALAGWLVPELHVENSRGVAAVATWVHQNQQRSGMGEFLARHGETQALRAQLGVEFWPLHVRDRSIGVLELVYAGSIVPDPEREQVLGTLVNGVAIALEQERLSEEEDEARLAREADRLKSTLLSSLSHDLRTPLAGIKAAASSLLQRDVLWSDADKDCFLRDIDTEADRLGRLVANLLDLSRIEAGAIVPMREWEDVVELIARVIARLETQLLGHPVTREGPTSLPSVRVDAVQIEQVLTNLLENAAKYSPLGAPITVSATIGTTESGRKELCLSVSDHGTGIPATDQVRIFNTFYRGASTSPPSRGTGMGLAIVKGLVESHGGHVELQSEIGKGSTFTVVIPVETTDHGEVDAETEHLSGHGVTEVFR